MTALLEHGYTKHIGKIRGGSRIYKRGGGANLLVVGVQSTPPSMLELGGMPPPRTFLKNRC